MTAEQFLGLPERTTAQRRELLDGEIVVNEPTPLHQLVVRRLLTALGSWTDAGPDRGFVTLNIDTLIDAGIVLVPDLQWYAPARDLPPLDRPPWPLGDLVIEVRSPSTWHRDVGRKRAIYEREGVSELWLVDPPARSVVVMRRSPGSTTFDATGEVDQGSALTSPMLADFAVPVADLFAT
jgi:Uma2 family endonuclease